jgi:hypothetical protein
VVSGGFLTIHNSPRLKKRLKLNRKDTKGAKKTGLERKNLRSNADLSANPAIFAKNLQNLCVLCVFAVKSLLFSAESESQFIIAFSQETTMTPLTQPLTFCPQCDTLLPPDSTACPACGQPRPAPESGHYAWPPAQIEGEPAAAPLLLGETLLLAANRLDEHGLPRQGLLHRLTLAEGRPLPPWELPAGQVITGVQIGPVFKTGPISLVLTTATADPVGQLGAVLALDAAGQEIWRWQPEAHTVSAPALTAETVWVVVRRELVGLNLADGQPHTRLALDFAPHRDTAPLLHQDMVILPRGRQLAALELATGQTRWQADLPPRGSYRFPAPAADESRLYLGGDKGVYALSLDSGQPAWHFATERTSRVVSVAAGVVYAAGHDRQLYALEAETGARLWQIEAAVERVELAPPLILAEPPLAIVADRKGHVTALALPLTPAQHEAAGRWLAAADGYAAQGDLPRAAGLYQQHGRPYRAAQLWAGLGQPLQQAGALALYAAALPEAEAAAVWSEAGQLYKAAGNIEQATQCQLEAARCLKLPLLKVEAHTEDGKSLLYQGWSRLRLTVANHGFGPAQTVSVRVLEKERFEGLITHTHKWAQIATGSSQTWPVDVRPLEFGDSVPLRLNLE